MIKQENSTVENYWKLKLETIKHKLFKYPQSKKLLRKLEEYSKKIQGV
jgi:hypothetical protein